MWSGFFGRLSFKSAYTGGEQACSEHGVLPCSSGRPDCTDTLHHHPEAAFLRRAINNFRDVAVLDWCKLFGSQRSEKHRWRRAINPEAPALGPDGFAAHHAVTPACADFRRPPTTRDRYAPSGPASHLVLAGRRGPRHRALLS